MPECLLVTLLMLLPAAGPDRDLRFEVESLLRKDLPDGFPFQALFEGFAILKIHVHNHSSESWSLDPGQLEIRDRKGKPLERATPFDVTPRIVKFYRGSSGRLFGEGYAGGEPTVEDWERVPTVSPGASPTLYSIETPKRIRGILEHYEVRAAEVAPGTSYQGLLYIRSKRIGRDLSGSVVTFGKAGSAAVP